MDTIYINYKNIKTSDPHRLVLNHTDKKSQREVMNILLYQILVFTIHGQV